MKSVIAPQSVPGNIGSSEFEISPCLIHRRLAQLTLFPASGTSVNHHRRASVQYQDAPNTARYLQPIFAKHKDLRINPHSIELGRRFSPIHF